MRRRDKDNSQWEPDHRASIRHRVAVEAARILYHREVKEYLHAKREAARRQGVVHMPSNREVHEQLLLIARKVDGDEHLLRLTAMRREAIKLMELLEPYRPRLIGSVLTGHIRKGSDIDLHAYSEDLDAICDTLREAGYLPDVEVVHSRKGGEANEYVHIHLEDVGGFEVEITLYAPEELHNHPRCGITGGAMKRATLAEVRQILRDSSPVAELAPAPPILSTPVDWGSVLALVPELLICRGVLQNNYHHLDVFDHTVEVVEGLERLLGARFSRLEPWAGRLCQHFATPESQTLLLLAGICHDLAKPATQAFTRDGNIRFPGHDLLGADIVRKIAPRMGLDHTTGDALARLVECHLECVMIPAQDGESSRIHRLFRRVGRHLPELAVLSLADVEAARGPSQTTYRIEEHLQFVIFLLEQYFEGGFLANPTLPVSAEDLEEQLGSIEAKTLDRLLASLMDAYVDGEFESREEGLSLASDFLDNPFQNGQP